MWSEQEEFGAFRAETDGLTGVISQDSGHFDNFSGGVVIKFHLIGGCHSGIPVDGAITGAVEEVTFHVLV